MTRCPKQEEFELDLVVDTCHLESSKNRIGISTATKAIERKEATLKLKKQNM